MKQLSWPRLSRAAGSCCLDGPIDKRMNESLYSVVTTCMYIHVCTYVLYTEASTHVHGMDD